MPRDALIIILPKLDDLPRIDAIDALEHIVQHTLKAPEQIIIMEDRLPTATSYLLELLPRIDLDINIALSPFYENKHSFERPKDIPLPRNNYFWRKHRNYRRLQ